ncbi:MAG: DUF4954 family protein [Tannerellaceae bacterium]|nr:DUF4954 family protein [Tannerellaceae bacterium]
METRRNLRPDEIAAMQAKGCSAEKWSDIWVPASFSYEHISNTTFSGKIVIGILEKEFTLSGGVKKHSGIHQATLRNCTIGNDVLIENVQNYIANYQIGAGCFIQNVNLIVAEEGTTFGNNVQVAVLNETGGREVSIYNKLSASLAYIIALYRHKEQLIHKLQKLITSYSESLIAGQGTIGSHVKIINSGTIKNVNIGEYTTIENCTRLENGSINSNQAAPVYIGDSVIAQDFIISSGAVVADAAKIIRCFIGQACHISHNFSAHDSLLFSNCNFENGEACAIFAGPYTVSIHKSSLLIAGMYSFLNAGSGSNQSNHMYKLGPIHQGIVERGSKTTSDSYILWPARVGAFSLVMGRHHHHSDTSEMPFSYLIEKDDETYLVPGVNLRSVGTIRDAQKWPKRDKRTDPVHLDRINYNLLSPYTIYKMLKAIENLKNLQQLVGETSEVYYYQNTRIKGSSLQNALQLYGMAIHKFLGNSLIKRLEKTNFRCMEEVWQQLIPTSAEGKGEWVDLSGLIIPKASLEKLTEAISNGKINSLTTIEEILSGMHSNYYDMEWTWAYQQIEEYYGVNLQQITASEIIDIIRQWQKAVTGLDELLYNDAKKEFSLTSMIGFGVDGSTADKQADFEHVRGIFEKNPFVTAVKEHIITKQALGNELISRLDPLV